MDSGKNLTGQPPSESGPESAPDFGADPAAADGRLRTMFLWATGLLFALSLTPLLIHMPAGETTSPVMMAKWLATKQDIPMIAVAIFLFSQFGSRVRAVGPASAPAVADRSRFSLRDWQVIILLVALAVMIWALRGQALFDYDLSRDEKMVAFDAAIFAQGHLFAPIPPFWRDYYETLNTNYILPIGDREGWVSVFLPLNAAMRALWGQFLPTSIVSPLQVAIAGFALWRITGRLWPDSQSTRMVVLALFVGSSQVVLMGTTIYAMTTHLAFNLVWLSLFLQRKPAAHAAAILLGFFATGIHQPLLHPIFVLPFLDMLRREKQWRTLAVYVVCYGAIGLFWLSWPNWVSSHGLHQVPASVNTAGIGFMERFSRGATPVSALSAWIMGANLLRFVAWQHVLLVPLAVVALRSADRADPVCRALWLGMILLLIVMIVVVPLPVHGWGYRYLHGFIGSAVLIAGYGWHRLEREGLAPVRAMRWATVVSLLIVLPVHVWMARTMVAPFAATAAWLERVPADLVVVDDGAAAFSLDLVLNRADLSNRPILLSSSKLQPSDLTGLCRGRTIAFANSDMFAPLDKVFGQQPLAGPSERQQTLLDAAPAAGCNITPIAR